MPQGEKGQEQEKAHIEFSIGPIKYKGPQSAASLIAILLLFGFLWLGPQAFQKIAAGIRGPVQEEMPPDDSDQRGARDPHAKGEAAKVAEKADKTRKEGNEKSPRKKGASDQSKTKYAGDPTTPNPVEPASIQVALPEVPDEQATGPKTPSKPSSATFTKSCSFESSDRQKVESNAEGEGAEAEAILNSSEEWNC